MKTIFQRLPIEVKVEKDERKRERERREVGGRRW